MKAAAAPPRWRVYLLLGRVSNLPTVWTDCLAGIFLAGAEPRAGTALWLALALSLFYTGGMFLNDAFDRPFDRVHRPGRPLPQGWIGPAEAWAAGFVQLALGEALLAVPAAQRSLAPGAAWPARLAGTPLLALAGGAVLAALIVYYNYSHKRSALSPLTMALCRAMVYLIAGATAGALDSAAAPGDASTLDRVAVPGGAAAPGAVGLPPMPLAWGALALICYLIGLTYAAKQETLREVKNLWPLGFLAGPFAVGGAMLGAAPWGWGLAGMFLAWVLYSVGWLVRREGRNIPRAVAGLLAGICLLDGMLMSGAGAGPGWALLAAAGFALTLVLQRFVPGT